MNKIERLSLKNFRGAKERLDINLDSGTSALIYGDNGTGKSSIADAAEWFFFDKVSHLSGTEVGGKHEGLKHSLSGESEECYVEILFSDKSTGRKNLHSPKGVLKSATSLIDTGTLESFREDHMILRNEDLVRFILAGKTARLEEISTLIGFDIVNDTKTHLKKSLNEIKSEIKSKQFEENMAKERSTIAIQTGAIVNSSDQFFSACSALIAQTNSNSTINSMLELEEFETALKNNTDSKESRRLEAVASISLNHEGCHNDLVNIKDRWDRYFKKLSKTIGDEAKLRAMAVSKLLDEASNALSYHETDDCPVCQQTITKSELILSIKRRLLEIQSTKHEIEEIELERKTLSENLSKVFLQMDSFANNALIIGDKDLSSSLFTNIESLYRFQKALNSNIFEENHEASEGSTCNDAISLISKIAQLADKYSHSMKERNTSSKVELATKIAVAKSAFVKLMSLQKESMILEKQKISLSKIVSHFNRLQMDGMTAFLDAVSNELNDLYSYMSVGESISGVKLQCLTDEKTGEFSGIAVSVKFLGEETTAPKKYLSESKLGMFGVCLFLASVSIYNRKAKFFILDDIISSFDDAHRSKFGQLLIEKFKDYQIILLTHEKGWFSTNRSFFEKNGWFSSETQWISSSGTHLLLKSS